MKNIILSFAVMTAGLLSAQTSDIKVEINNIKNSKGNIALALYNSAKNFTKQEIKAITVQAKKGKVYAIFKDIPAGTYAIALLHDENKNDEMDFNMMGIPKEAYGFSNNAKGFLSPPKFEDAAFTVKKSESKKIKISL